MSQARNQQEEGRKLCEMCLPKRQLTFNGLYGVVSQKIELFITTGMKISDPTHPIEYYVT
jgi:hypothetical protein